MIKKYKELIKQFGFKFRYGYENNDLFPSQYVKSYYTNGVKLYYTNISRVITGDSVCYTSMTNFCLPLTRETHNEYYTVLPPKAKECFDTRRDFEFRCTDINDLKSHLKGLYPVDARNIILDDLIE